MKPATLDEILLQFLKAHRTTMKRAPINTRRDRAEKILDNATQAITAHFTALMEECLGADEPIYDEPKLRSLELDNPLRQARNKLRDEIKAKWKEKI